MRKVTKYFFAVDRDPLWNSLMSLKSNSKRQNEFVVKHRNDIKTNLKTPLKSTEFSISY